MRTKCYDCWIMDSLPENTLGKALFLSLMLFLLVGFLVPPKDSLPRETRKTSAGSLTKINLSSKNTRNYITQGYGYTHFAAVFNGLANNRHNGIDIAGAYGAEIHSESDGLIVYSGNQDKYCYGKAYGKFVMVRNKKGDYTLLYAHLSKINVRSGDNAKKGDVLGLVGDSGLATGPHLHFSVFKTDEYEMIDDESCGPKPEGKTVNPLDYLDW